MLDLVGAVRAEHRRILARADAVAQRFAKRPFDRDRARRAVHALTVAESRHEVAEARYVWPVVRDLLPELAEVRAAGEADERQLRRWLKDLHAAAGSVSAAPLAERVAASVVSHVGLEESHVLPALAATLSERDAYRLGRQYQRASAAAPTRPHPHVPAIPGVLAAVSPLARRLDHVRDLLHMP